MVAGILEMVVFAWVDPGAMSLGSWEPSAKTVYSLSFFAFWALIAVASAVSHWMMVSAAAAVPAQSASSESQRDRRQGRRPHAHRHA